MDLDLDRVVDFVFVVHTEDVVVGLELFLLFFLIVVFVKDRLFICSNLLRLLFVAQKVKRRQINLEEKRIEQIKILNEI